MVYNSTMDSYIGWLIIVIIVAGFGLLFYFLKNQKKGNDKTGDPAFLMLQGQLQKLEDRFENIRGTLDDKLGESTRTMQDQFSKMQNQSSESRKIVQEVTERLTKLDETNRQVVNFADQLKHLQDILKNPKQRGIVGEYYLQTVLENVLPPGSFQMQYPFSDGMVVDAVVFVDKRIIPIDSKFSLENYSRFIEASDSAEKKRYESAFLNDIKTRIEETSKYVKPGTMDFAFMFIPSEAVYYDLLINKVGIGEGRNMIQYAGERKVIIVSPTSFLAYLQTVLQGLRGQKISEQVVETIKRVENLGRHLSSYDVYMQKVGTNLGTTVNMFTSAYKEFKKIDKDVVKISGLEMGIEPMAIDGPQKDVE